MRAPHPPARFTSRLAAWLVDIALCAIPAMFVAWAMVRVPAVALVDAAPVDGSVLEMERHLVEYVKMQARALAWFTAGLVASYGVLTVVCEAGLHQATPGKRIMQLQVEDAHGRSPTTGQALLRFAAGSLSWATLNMGHAMVLLRADRRALHDIVSGLCVVALPIPEGHPPRAFAIAVIIAASVLFWVLLPSPVPESPVVEQLIEQGIRMVMSPEARSIGPVP